MLFAYLVLHRDRPVSRDELIDILWQGDPPGAPGAALSTLLARLRRVLGHELLDGRAHLFLRFPADAWIDVEAAGRAAADAEAALARGEAALALELARAALALIARPLLPEFDALWVDQRRRELAEVSAEVLDTMARAALDLGPAELGTAERAATALIEREPYRESGYALLMQAHASQGDVAKAVCVFERLRLRLREELGVAPAAAVTALHERLVKHGDVPDLERPAPRRPTGAVTPFPATLARSELRTLIGRHDHLERLRELWRRTPQGEGGLVLVTGEAGIGKTRVVSRLGAEAHASGATVLYGRADEETVVPYQPFVEAMRHYAQHAPGLAEEPTLSAHRTELVRLVPEIGGPHETRVDGDQESQRYRLFEAVVDLLIYATENGPLLLVLEDLHWAGRSTLLLLKHVVRHTEGQPVMLLGTYRDTEMTDADPLARVLANLRREHPVRRIPLEGLDEQETRELVSDRTHVVPSPGFNRGLCGRTAGNPFFIEETLRDLEEQPSRDWPGADRLIAPLGVPEGVKEVIARRVERLSPLAAEAMMTAAVLGSDFRLEALRAVTEMPAAHLMSALEQGIDAGLLTEDPQNVDCFSFDHALVHQTLSERPVASRRRRMHLAAGTALEAAYGRLGVHPAELARHFFEAREIGGAERALKYCVEAARRAEQSRAYEAAAHQYERALIALDIARRDAEAARCDLLLALGGVRWQGSEPGARDACEQAAELARRLGSPEQLARAALGAGGRFYAPIAADHSYIALLTEALETLGAAKSGLRARVMARLGENVALAESNGRGAELASQAVDMARQVGDGCAIAAALMSLHATLLFADYAEERAPIAAEAYDTALAYGAPELAALADHWLLYDLFELGRVREADLRKAQLDELARELQQPLYRHSALAWRCVHAQLAGRVDEAERLARESLRVAEHGGSPDAHRHFTAQLFALRREQGRLGELLPAIAQLAQDPNAPLLWQAALPLALAESGSLESAREAFERVAPDLEVVPPGITWLAVIALLAESAVALGDVQRADPLYRMLEPYAERFVQAGFAGNLGSTHRILGRLALLCGDPKAARGHLEAALTRHDEIGARILTARTQRELTLAQSLEANSCIRDLGRRLSRPNSPAFNS